MLTVTQYVNPTFSSNSFVVRESNRKDCFLVDCGDSQELFTHLSTGNLNVVAVLLSHAHFDHICGLNRLLEMYPSVKIYTNAFGREALLSEKLNLSKYHAAPFTIADEDAVCVLDEGVSDIALLGEKVEVFFVPGHNPSCLAYRIKDCFFTGDAYIPGVKVITNIPKADKSLAMDNYRYLETCSSGCMVYAGHGEVVER